MCKIARNNNQSTFICVKCQHTKGSLLNGIFRKRLREKYHIKDSYCFICGQKTKQMEVRSCDAYEDVLEKVKEVRDAYYPNDGQNFNLCENT